MDVLAWLLDQGGRGLCLGLLTYVLARIALGYVESRPVPPTADSRSTVARARGRARANLDIAAPWREAFCESVAIRDGWQTARSNHGPEGEGLLLFDLYAYLRRTWDDGYEARQTTRGLIGGGTGEQPRPKRLVKAARQWAKETGAGGAIADRLLNQLIEIGAAAQSVDTAHSAGDIGWRLLRPEEAAPLFQRAVGVGIERVRP